MEDKIAPPCFEPNCEFCPYSRFCKNRNPSSEFIRVPIGRPKLNLDVVEERILNYLKFQGKADSKAIVKMIGHSRNVVETILNKLYRENLIVFSNQTGMTHNGLKGRIWEIKRD